MAKRDSVRMRRKSVFELQKHPATQPEQAAGGVGGVLRVRAVCVVLGAWSARGARRFVAHVLRSVVVYSG